MTWTMTFLNYVESSPWSGSYLAQMESAGLLPPPDLNTDNEDVDMEELEYIAKHQDIENDALKSNEISDKIYLAIDTNVFMKHLKVVQQVFEHFSRSSSIKSQTNITYLLIPTMVINELDKFASYNGENPPEIVRKARTATKWLLSINKLRRETGYGAIRCQKWSERLNENLNKPDDRVLDCCLFFKEKGCKDIVLWTEDQNLSLLAEANDIKAIAPALPSLKFLLSTLRIQPLPEDIVNVSQATMLIMEDGMEIDSDLLPPNVNTDHIHLFPPSPSRCESHSSVSYSSIASRRPSPPSSNIRSPLLTSPSTPSRRPSPPLPSKIPYRQISANILVGISSIAISIFNSLPQLPASTSTSTSTSSGSDSPIRLAIPTTPTQQSTISPLQQLIDKLESLEILANTIDDKRNLFRLISCLITLKNWSSKQNAEKATRGQVKVLDSEAADSVIAIQEAVSLLGLTIESDFRSLEEEIRKRS